MIPICVNYARVFGVLKSEGFENITLINGRYFGVSHCSLIFSGKGLKGYIGPNHDGELVMGLRPNDSGSVEEDFSGEIVKGLAKKLFPGFCDENRSP